MISSKHGFITDLEEFYCFENNCFNVMQSEMLVDLMQKSLLVLIRI